MDNDPHWIETIQSLSEQSTPFSSIRAVQANADSTSLPSSSFDIVTCQTLLLHVPDPAAVLKEMIRLCKVGGTVLLVEPCNVVNRSQLYEAIALGDIDDAPKLLKAWLAYHKGAKMKSGMNYDIGLVLVEILGGLGIKRKDIWGYGNPKLLCNGTFKGDLADEYSEEK